MELFEIVVFFYISIVVVEVGLQVLFVEGEPPVHEN